MLEILLLTLLGQAALPLGLILSLGRRRQRALEWALGCFALALLLALLAVAGVWLLLPWYAPHLLAAAGAAAALAACRAIRRGAVSAESRRPVVWRCGALAAGGLVSLAALAAALGGRIPPGPGEAAAVASPLAGGSHYVVNGGRSILINPHMKTLADPALAAHRGQAYALDVVALDGLGLRARGLFPRSLERYAIFGRPVYAPCGGRVVAAEGGLPDRTPGEIDADRPAGNFVRIDCGGFEVLLAHLEQGSLAVSVGQEIAAGDPLGRVGNSGRSLEPHLHLHAERGGEPLPLLVDGRFLVRGSRF